MTHEEYLERRNVFEKIRNDSFDSFDKTILMLSTGAIALSVTFLEKIGKPFNIITLLLLLVSWLLYFIVIISHLLSFHFAKRNMDSKIQELDNDYKNQIENEVNIDSKQEKTFWQHKAVLICNLVALVCFICGTILFTIYVSCVQLKSYNDYRKNYAKEENRICAKEENMTDQGQTKKDGGKEEIKKPATKGKVETPIPIEKPRKTIKK